MNMVSGRAREAKQTALHHANDSLRRPVQNTPCRHETERQTSRRQGAHNGCMNVFQGLSAPSGAVASGKGTRRDGEGPACLRGTPSPTQSGLATLGVSVYGRGGRSSGGGELNITQGTRAVTPSWDGGTWTCGGFQADVFVAESLGRSIGLGGKAPKRPRRSCFVCDGAMLVILGTV